MFTLVAVFYNAIDVDIGAGLYDVVVLYNQTSLTFDISVLSPNAYKESIDTQVHTRRKKPSKHDTIDNRRLVDESISVGEEIHLNVDKIIISADVFRLRNSI